jgi:hypothetical protein
MLYVALMLAVSCIKWSAFNATGARKEDAGLVRDVGTKQHSSCR